MSWWTNVRDTIEGVATGGLAGLVNDSLADKMGGAFNKITGRESADTKRNRQYAINDQIKAYKDQTALNNQELQKIQGEKDVAKRQINEKQIRAIRNQYRPSGGFLNQGTGNALGAGSLPTKLGT